MLTKYLKPYYLRMAFGFTIKSMGAFMELGLPWILAYIIDDIIPRKNISMIFIFGGIMILLAIGARTFNILANRMASKVARDSVETLRHDLFERIFGLSGSQVDGFTIPSLEARMTTDTYHLHHMIGMMQRMGVRAPINLIGGIIITSTLEPVLALVLASVLPFMAFVVYIVTKKGVPLYGQLQHKVDNLIRVVRENISGVRVIKALSKTDYEKERFGKANDEVVDKELKAGTTMAMTNPSMNLLLNLGLALVIIVGAYRVNSGASLPGKIVAFMSYFTIMLHAVMAISRIFIIGSRGLASANRISQVLETEEDLEVIEELDIKDDEYHIRFNHVHFSYHNEPCITDVDFGIKRGESLGIIGSTGAGKTTLINLLMRFYDVNKGSIMIDGKDIRSFDKQELRRKFGVVFQNDVLFADTIYENIDIGRDLSREEVREATVNAQASSFINEREEGLDYKLAIRGSDLSGGQKQRLLISRALAGNPEILILDDSSSALDYRTDSKLRRAINENYHGVTSIFIAQRISSVMKLDNILVIEEGQIVGFGPHEKLLETCQVYQEIYESQMM